MFFDIDRRVSRRFSTFANGGEDDELTKEVTADATVERLEVRFYSGPQGDLELEPFIEYRDGDRIPLIDIVGRDVLVGDDDVFQFHVSEPIREGDTIGVEYVNNEGSFGYDFHVDMTLERAGGIRRIVEAIERWT